MPVTRYVEPTDSWSDFIQKLLLEPNHSGELRQWPDVWRALVDHPGVRAELQRRSRRALAHAEHLTVTAEDVAHDAMLILARQLARSADLSINRARGEPLDGWIGTIFDRACGEALRRERRHVLAVGAPVVDLAAPPEGNGRELQIDLAAAIARLPASQRPVAALHLAGYSLPEVAAKLGMGPSKAAHLWADARPVLRHALSAYRDEEA